MNRGDPAGLVGLFDPDAEAVFPREVPEPGPFRGRDQIRQWAEGYLAAWEEHVTTLEELIEVGDRIVAAMHHRGRGRGSSAELEQRDVSVFMIREGKIAHWRMFWSRDVALQAATLDK